MPRGREHDRITLAFVGYNVPAVHRTMDYAVRVIGPSHQVVMHDGDSIRAMQLLYGPRARVVAALHVLEDLRIIR